VRGPPREKMEATMRRDFIVYQTRREQVGILGLIIDALFGKKKVKSVHCIKLKKEVAR
jgi:hypothetical protein